MLYSNFRIAMIINPPRGPYNHGKPYVHLGFRDVLQDTVR